MASFPGVPFGIFLFSVCAVVIGLIQVSYLITFSLLEAIFYWMELKSSLLATDINWQVPFFVCIAVIIVDSYLSMTWVIALLLSCAAPLCNRSFDLKFGILSSLFKSFKIGQIAIHHSCCGFHCARQQWLRGHRLSASVLSTWQWLWFLLG